MEPLKADQTAERVLGVHVVDGRFVAQLRVSGAIRRVGAFDTPEEAHAAYIKAKRELHPGCTI